VDHSVDFETDRYHGFILRVLGMHEKLRYESLEGMVCKHPHRMSPATFRKKLKELVSFGKVKHFRDPRTGIGWYTTKERFVRGMSTARDLQTQIKGLREDYDRLRRDWPEIDTKERAELVVRMYRAISIARSHCVILLQMNPDNDVINRILTDVDSLSSDLGQFVAKEEFEKKQLVHKIQRRFSNEMWNERGYEILSSRHAPE